MKKKLFIGGVILLWVVTGIFLTFSLNKEDEAVVAQTFGKIKSDEMTGAVFVEGNIEGTYLTGEEQEQLLRSIAIELGIETECQVQTERRSAYQRTLLVKESDMAELSMEITTYEAEVEENVIEARQYFYMELKLDKYIGQVVLLKEELEELLQKYSIDSDYRMEFRARFDGVLSMDEKNRISQWLLEETDSKVVADEKTNEIYTIYAYTEYISEFELVNNRAINVNLVFHYDEEQDLTYFYMATPYMYSEY